jgi:uncharacterized membrane protein
MAEQDISQAEGNEAILFEAEIKPHRSLSPRGMSILVSIIGVSSFIITLIWYSLGAWPVAGFNGADIMLVVFLLRYHARHSRAVERVVLTESGFQVSRIDEKGRQTSLFVPSGWARVDLEERPGRVPALYLASHGRRVEVGACLGEAQKQDLAAAIGQALHGFRHPVFDNPQLRG